MDYYSILGLQKNATDQDIRKAYKKMSMKYHPDRGGDEEKFKLVNEAYQTLGDQQKRSEYDNPQPQYKFNTTNSPFGPGFEDVFSQFGFRPHRASRSRNKDVRLSYTLEFLY